MGTKALNDRAKEGFIKIKAEPDERPGVAPSQSLKRSRSIHNHPFVDRRIMKVMSDLGFRMPKLPDEVRHGIWHFIDAVLQSVLYGHKTKMAN